MSQELSQALGGSFESNFYIPVITEGDPAPAELLDLFSAGQEVFYGGICMPQAARHSVTVMVDRIA